MDKVRFIPISQKEANGFIRKFHRHSKPVVGDKFRVGLVDNKGELVGVALAGRPVARMLDNGRNIEIVRVCVKEGFSNACSMLYGRIAQIAKLMGYEKIITYTLKKETQSAMKAVGAVKEAEINPQEWDRPNRKRKSQKVYQETKIRWELNKGAHIFL